MTSGSPLGGHEWLQLSTFSVSALPLDTQGTIGIFVRPYQMENLFLMHLLYYSFLFAHDSSALFFEREC